MDKKTEMVILKKKGTKKQYREVMQRRRVKSFLNQKLGTQTHASKKEYSRRRDRELLQKEQEGE